MVLSSGEFNHTIDAGLFQKGSIHAFGFLDINGDGIQNSGDSAFPDIPGKTFQLNGPNGFTQTVTTTSGKANWVSLMPGTWRSLKAVSPTLRYDFAVLGDTQSGNAMPAELTQKLAAIDVPTLILVGGKSPPWMHHAVARCVESIAGATSKVLPGQDHNVSAKAVAPELTQFFAPAA